MTISTKKVSQLDSVGNIEDGDILVGERPNGTTVRITYVEPEGGVSSVNTKTGAVVLDPDDLVDTATTNKFTTALDISKLAGIEAGATADQTAAEIKTAYESNSNTNAFNDDAQTKLAGIEALADVTDETNVTDALDGAVLAAATIATNDKVLIQDTDAADILKTVTTLAVRDLTPTAGFTGTGAEVRATSPTLVTPALGTPSALILTNATGLPISGLAGGTDGQLITWDASGNPDTVAVGTANQVLTSNGAGAAPTFQDGGGLPDTAFHAYRTTAQTIPNITFTKLQLNVERFDTGGMYDNTTNYRYTPTVAGKYIFVGTVGFSAVADQITVIVSIYKNGSVICNNISTTSTVVSTSIELQSSIVTDMNGSTDYIELYVYQGTGGNKDAVTSNLSGCLVEI